MDKAIYGLATTFKYPTIDYEFLTNKYIINIFKPDSIILDSSILATLGHNYTKLIGYSKINLELVLNEQGLFFKIVPETDYEVKVYNQVKRGLFTQCSCTYYHLKKYRDYEAEKRLAWLKDMWKGNEAFEVYEHEKVRLIEICLTNTPKNKETFCTTDPNHPLLTRIDWEGGEED